MPRAEQRLLAALTLVAGVVMGLACFTEVGAELLFFLPLLVVVLPLIGGRYWGEGTLERLRERRAQPARASTDLVLPVRRITRAVIRPGALMGMSLAVRPPPAHALSH
jgi:hypothetical protein